LVSLYRNRNIQDSIPGQLPQVTIFLDSLRLRQCWKKHDTKDALLRRIFQFNIHIYILTGYYSRYLPFVNATESLNTKERKL